ncbi:hypothetical protein Nepgr_022222 [Nepenthes gracilis]|uniref:histidine kinase n=1 Tax=Nepenthes gracilis TaxID=150966 RepID=A0AAD3T0E7_NEPGR|nr:hypothetical protein Nepgr_022222 [Nepenthes gracilis]
MYGSDEPGDMLQHVSPLNFGDLFRRHEMQCRFKHKPPWPWLAITATVGILIIALLVDHIFHATVNRIAEVEDDYHEMMELKKRAKAAEVAKSEGKIESGKLKLEAVTFDLRAILDDLSFVNRASLRKKLAVYISDRVPDMLIGDPRRFRQIITNLIGSSIKVEDTGVGIPSEAQSRVFTPFMQVGPSISRTHGGTGIGLSITK